MMSIKKNLICFTLLAGLFMVSSCNKDDDMNMNPNTTIEGEGPIVTETLSVANFTGVNLALPSNVTIKQGATQEVVAMGQANIIDLLTTAVSNNIWEIGFESGVSVSNFDLSIEITVPNINSIEVSGTGSIEVNNFDNQGSLSLSVNGAGSITLNQFEGIAELTSMIRGTGDISANDDITTLQTLNVSMSGTGNFYGFPITSDDCTVTNSGTGNARVTANNTLNVTINGAGNVHYKGNPTITQSINGTGMLIDAN